ncbi:MAG: outer membrane lipoprotein chaperone LolA [Methylotenera sp.]|uniref:outer membrane lipoprotein chaperone LolA n=1 Tax=Methylotenera sp. TaxID=2051956 RepID=UPI0017CC1CD0|nr:outer membrane lipoprotein chaperone LolA [Methylotenera sp.]NOU24558.1 outer membrane lipoprotein chaperone LolA [Methylotenera sp.]
MHKIKKMVFVSFLALPLLAQADGIASLRKFYNETHALSANFYQVVTDRQGKKIQEVYGEMQLKRPNKFRWDYNKPYEQQIISDGKQVWLYDTELAQVSVRELSKTLGSSPAALLAGDDSLDKNFKLVNAVSKDGLDWVTTNPKDSDTGFNKISLAFKNDVLYEMDMVDSFGHQTKIVFSNLVHNPIIEAKTFLFKPPKGVDVVGE